MATDETSLRLAVALLEAELARAAPALGAWLSPPAAEPERRALELSLRVLLPSALDTWLSLHDGQDDRQYPCLERWLLLPIRRIASSHAALCRARLDPLAGSLSRFSPSLVPFASDEAGAHLCVEPGGAVIELQDDARTARVVATDLAAWLDACARAIREGRWQLAPDIGRLEEVPH